MEREIAQKQPVNTQNIVENARLSARFCELFRPGLSNASLSVVTLGITRTRLSHVAHVHNRPLLYMCGALATQKANFAVTKKRQCTCKKFKKVNINFLLDVSELIVLISTANTL